MSNPTQLAIKQPGTIWAQLIEESATAQKKPDGRGDAFCYFVGSRGSGKTTLLNRFLYPSRVEPPKPSEGLEYTFARKASNFDHEKKDLAHIWEIAGSAEFSKEIAQGEQIFMTVKQVTTAAIVILVDLSDPSSVMPTATMWLDHVKAKLAVTFEKFEKKGLQLPEQLRQRAKARLFGGNEDKDTVYHAGVPIIVAATKYDLFKDQDVELKKVMARALRFLAHSHGASLMYTSSLQEPSLTSNSEPALLLDTFSKLLNHLIFTGMEKKPPFRAQPQVDHLGPLMVLAGTDHLKDIGRPRGAYEGNMGAAMQEWKDLMEKTFPPRTDKVKAAFEIGEQYAQEEVDIVRTRKTEELRQFVKDNEATKTAPKKKASKAK